MTELKTRSTADMEKTGITMLVYGKPGAGKTTLAGTVPDTILINIEGGTAVLSGQNIDVIDVKPENIVAVLEFLSNDTKYKNVFFDSATELEMAMLIYLGRTGKNHGVPELGHYQRVQFGLRDILRQFRDLNERGKNVVVTAHEMDLGGYRDDGSQYSRIVPKLSKKIVFEICGIFDIVAHIEISSKEGQAGKRFLRLDPTAEIEAKNRWAHKWPMDSQSKGRWFELPEGKMNLENMFAIIDKTATNSSEKEK